MLDKYNNFEFEAKLYRDIAGHFNDTGSALFLSMNLPESMWREYNTWILEIISRSDISFTESDLQKYYKFLSATTLPGTPDLNISPLVLIALIYNLKSYENYIINFVADRFMYLYSICTKIDIF